MARLIPQKLTFMAKYGSPADRAKVSTHVDQLLDKAEKGNPGLYSEIASASEIPLQPHQVHRIIDSPKFEGMNHPSGMLARWHFGDLKDDHWDKIARQPTYSDVSIVASFPKKHLKFVADSHPNSFVRQIASNHYRSKYGPDDDELVKELKS